MGTFDEINDSTPDKDENSFMKHLLDTTPEEHKSLMKQIEESESTLNTLLENHTELFIAVKGELEKIRQQVRDLKYQSPEIPPTGH